MGGARIGALAIIVPDYDAGIAFYVGKLGFDLTEDIDQGHKRWVTVCPPGGGTRIVLSRAEGAAQQAAIGAQGGGRVWLFLHTDDFPRDHAAMQGRVSPSRKHRAANLTATSQSGATRSAIAGI